MKIMKEQVSPAQQTGNDYKYSIKSCFNNLEIKFIAKTF